MRFYEEGQTMGGLYIITNTIVDVPPINDLKFIIVDKSPMTSSHKKTHIYHKNMTIKLYTNRTSDVSSENIANLISSVIVAEDYGYRSPKSENKKNHDRGCTSSFFY